MTQLNAMASIRGFAAEFLGDIGMLKGISLCQHNAWMCIIFMAQIVTLISY